MTTSPRDDAQAALREPIRAALELAREQAHGTPSAGECCHAADEVLAVLDNLAADEPMRHRAGRALVYHLTAVRLALGELGFAARLQRHCEQHTLAGAPRERIREQQEGLRAILGMAGYWAEMVLTGTPAEVPQAIREEVAL